MANPIQAIRQVYDIEKSARENGCPFDDEDIKRLLERTVSDSNLISQYARFQKGYATEDLFMRIYSLLPWIKSIVPLGQEQFPEKSKEYWQICDYEMTFEAGSSDHIEHALLEVKLIDGNKKTFQLEKYKYDVLNRYSTQKKEVLLFALFWRKYGIWTVNSIEAFSEKSSSYKISYQDARSEDLSAIFGDYTYFFNKTCIRKSVYSTEENVQSTFLHGHETYGKTMSEKLSTDGSAFSELCVLEPAVLDSSFDFREVSNQEISAFETEVVEELVKTPYIYKLSSLIMQYLWKMFLFDKNKIAYVENTVTENAFDIVDTVRRKCGGERFYQLPYTKTKTVTELIKLQFGKVPNIMSVYNGIRPPDAKGLMVSHDEEQIIYIVDKNNVYKK